MDLRHLRFFLTLADELHFTRAAARLGIAQPHLSQEIQRLERELGAELLRRTRRHVELTPAGEAFREGAGRVMAAIDEAVDAARRAARGEAGRLVVGFVGSAAWDPFPEVVRRFRTERPGVRVLLEERTTPQALDGLRLEALDVALVRATSLEEPGLILEVIRREPFIVALPRGHALAGRRSVELGDLADEPWIAFEYTAGPGLHAQLIRACEEAGFRPRIMQTSGNIPVMLSLVAGGLGVALVPAQVRTLRARGVRLMRLAEPAPMTAVIAARRREERSPAALRFIELLKELQS